MFKIILVDDEPLVKVALKSLIDWRLMVTISVLRHLMDRKPWSSSMNINHTLF